MDNKIRDLERQAAQGDEQARLRLYQTYEQVETLGGLKRFASNYKSICANGKTAFVAAMQRIINSYPVFGFVYQLEYYDACPNQFFVTHLKKDAFPTISQCDWYSFYWNISTQENGDEFDIDYIPEYVGMFGKSQDEVAKHFTNSYGNEGKLFWDTISVLYSFRKMVKTFSIPELELLMGDGATYPAGASWACNSEGFYDKNPDMADAMQGIYQGMLLDEYRKEQARVAQLKDLHLEQEQRKQQEQEKMIRTIRDMTDEQRQDFLSMYGNKSV